MGGFTPSVASPCLEVAPGLDAGEVCDQGCKDILTGMLNGLLSDTQDFDTCSLDGLQDVLLLAASVSDLQEKKFLDFTQDLSIFFGKIAPTFNDCKVMAAEVEHLLGALKSLSPAHVAANVKAHHTEILGHVASWSAAVDAQANETIGIELGTVI